MQTYEEDLTSFYYFMRINITMFVHSFVPITLSHINNFLTK
jgi:hypothetical protein